MSDVNVWYKIMQYAVGKNQSQGYLSPDDFYFSINQAQQSYCDYLLGEYQKYQIKRPIAAVEFSQNQRVRSSIAPLIYGTVLPINQTTGVAPFPSDFVQVDAMWSLYGIYDIRFVQQDSLNNYNRSAIDPIVQNPVYLMNHEGFQFFPTDPYGYTSSRMSYVRNPPSIVWGYNLDSNGIPVYNPATSQQPVWAESDGLNIIVRALRIVGVNLDYNTVGQYATEIKQIGQ